MNILSQQSALLALEDGSVFWGYSIGVDGRTTGEVVFNTSMTGYQEILTDPSYSQQMVTLTYPHIGNTGVNAEDAESSAIYASGLIIKDLPRMTSSWRAEQSLGDYLSSRGVVAIAGIDTRALTVLLRNKGALNGCILTHQNLSEDNQEDIDAAIAAARGFPGLKGMDLACRVTTDHIYQWHQGSWELGQGYRSQIREDYHIIAYDFGIKHNILRLLADRNCKLTVVPAKTPASEVLSMDPDGVFLSNGPGDPQPCDYAIAAIKEILQTSIPIFGICLGHQLLALASGAKSEKMKFGHHGANHPVAELSSGKVMITSQNHGFAIAADSLPDNLQVTHRSLFDQSIQGVRRTDKPAFGFQGHPEASPGPHDITGLFDQFIDAVKHYRTSKHA